MAYNTGTELVTQIRRLINEPSALVHSDTEIVSYINRGAEEIGRRSLCMENSVAATTLAADTWSFAFSAITEDYESGGIVDTVKVDSVLYWGPVDPSTSYVATGAKALIKVNPRQISHDSEKGTLGPPIEWWVQDEILYIWPPSSSVEATHYISVNVHTKPNTYNDGAKIPVWLREYVIWYSVAKCFEKEGKYAQHDQYLSYFHNFIDFHRVDRMLSKVPDSKDMMTIPDRTQYIGGGG